MVDFSFKMANFSFKMMDLRFVEAKVCFVSSEKKDSEGKELVVTFLLFLLVAVVF